MKKDDITKQIENPRKRDEIDERALNRKRLIIGIVLFAVVIALAVSIALAVKSAADPNKLPETSAPETLPNTPDSSEITSTTAVITDDYGSTVTPPVTAGTTIPGQTVTTDSGSVPPVTTTGTTQILEKRSGVYTFLVCGLDKGKMLTDVIMVVTFDTNNNSVNVLNIPRDTYSAAATNRTEGLHHINLAYSTGGIERLEKEVFEMIGFRVDRYILVDMNAFVKIVNYMGGVYFNVPQNMYYVDPSQDCYIDLKKGEQTLSGAQALQLVRYRSDYFNGDIGRVEMRSKFLKAMASQLLTASNASRAAELAGVVFDSVTTDMTRSDLIWYASQLFEVPSSSVNFYTLPGTGIAGSPMWFPYKNELLNVINKYMNPYNQNIVTINIVSRPETAGK